MSIATQEKKAISAPAEFRQRSTQIASTFLRDWVGEERAREATGRIATALSASAAAAKNPQDFYDCTPQSIAKVIAISALTGIMVSTGQAALAYAIPRRPRKGEPPQLQYQLSHRGIAALAKRADLSLVAYPISYADEVDTDQSGEVVIKSRDIDNPPQDEESLRGVMVLVRSTVTGTVLSRGFVAKKIINARREQSDSYLYAEKPGNSWAKDSSPWHKWYTEMAIKTAMHYAIGRGWCVIDDTEAVRALSVDAEGDYKQVQVTLEERSKTDLIAERLAGAAVEEEKPKGLAAADLPPNASKRLTEWWNAMASKSDDRELAALCDEASLDTELTKAEKDLLWAESMRRSGN
jgi:recombinational DNA repair protein RecT